MFILISDAFAQDLPDNLIRFGEVSQDKDCLSKADVVLIRSKTKVTKEYIDSAPNLKLVIRGGVGLDNVDLEYAREKGIIVRNTPAASSIAVAELAFTLMICLPNHVVKGHNSMHAGEWIKKELKRSELYGKTLGILGLGRIGVELAKRAAVFGMKVIAYDPFVSESEYAEIIPQLTDVLNKADFVSMHMPLTDKTEGIINQNLLHEFKDGSYLINTGRGRTIVEDDVVAALASRKLAGFGTDVWYSDPPVNSPLIDAPNVLMLPHLGASTKENLMRIGEIICSIISEFNQ
jgi:D-3-phosphoglycerate dehydrogenase